MTLAETEYRQLKDQLAQQESRNRILSQQYEALKKDLQKAVLQENTALHENKKLREEIKNLLVEQAAFLNDNSPTAWCFSWREMRLRTSSFLARLFR